MLPLDTSQEVKSARKCLPSPYGHISVSILKFCVSCDKVDGRVSVFIKKNFFFYLFADMSYENKGADTS